MNQLYFTLSTVNQYCISHYLHCTYPIVRTGGPTSLTHGPLAFLESCNH